MKNYTVAGMLVPALLILLCSCAGSRASINDTTGINTATSAAAKPSDNGIYLNNINIKAVRHFRKTYAEPANEKWCIIRNGYMVKYTEGDVRVRVDYDQRGNWLYAIRYYDEKKLPKKVRRLVKSVWFDYSITIIEEIQRGDIPIYIVHMHEGDDWRMVQVYDDEMKELIPPGKTGSNSDSW